MRRYMWPNSCLPSATSLITAAHTATQGRFTLEGVENHASRKKLFTSLFHALILTQSLMNVIDYPRTLREWGRRLEKNLTVEMIAKDFPELRNNRSEFEAFKRKWQYLYAYAGAGFAKGYITCHMLTFVRQVCYHPVHIVCSPELTKVKLRKMHP